MSVVVFNIPSLILLLLSFSLPSSFPFLIYTITYYLTPTLPNPLSVSPSFSSSDSPSFLPSLLSPPLRSLSTPMPPRRGAVFVSVVVGGSPCVTSPDVAYLVWLLAWSDHSSCTLRIAFGRWVFCRGLGFRGSRWYSIITRGYKPSPSRTPSLWRRELLPLGPYHLWGVQVACGGAPSL